MEARDSVGLRVFRWHLKAMAHFLLIPNHEPCPPAGFSVLEKFICPNCGREVFITSTAHAEQYRREEIVKARNAVTVNCPVHELPACVDVPAEDMHLRR
jgi:hypothetical protein